MQQPWHHCQGQEGAEDRALRLYVSGLEWMAAFVGCPHAGALPSLFMHPNTIHLCHGFTPLWQWCAFFCRGMDSLYLEPAHGSGRL
jgi:hypothetical protein